MKTQSIAVLFALLFATQVFCRPNKNEKEDKEYIDDTPQEYDDDEGDSEGNKGASSEPPEIRSQPEHFRVTSGMTVEFPCDLHNAEDYATQWKKGNMDLYVGDVVMTQEPNRIVLGQNNELKIYNVTVNDSSDDYICQILTEPITKIVHSLHVSDAQDNKFIHVWPQKVIHVNESQSIKFGCEITKPHLFNPIPDIKWSHKGQRLHNGEIVEGGYITIKQATRHNNGPYQCLAEDGSQEPPYDSIDVFVNYAPVIEVEHEIVHTGFGMTSELSCKVHGHPRAKVTWLKNGKQISSKKDKRMMTEDKAIRALIIENTSKHDLGNYTCTATNVMGEASKDIELTGRPAKPKFVGAKINDDDSTLTVKWHVESFVPITQYSMEYRLKGDAEWKTVTPKINDVKNNIFTVEYTFKNLPTGAYEGVLLAQNEFGWSPRSQQHTFRKEMASEEPQNVKGLSGNASTTQPFTTLAALLLVVVSYVSISL